MPNETPSPFSAPKNTKTHIVGLLVVLIVLIAGLGALFYKTDLDAKNIRAGVSAIRTELQALKAKLTTDDTKTVKVIPDEKAVPETTIPTNWKTYSFGEYSFSYPADWSPATPTTTSDRMSMDFLNTKNEVVANLVCPMPETGYESWTFREFARSFTQNNRPYKIQVWFGEPTPESGVSTFLNMILMQRENEDTLAHSCQLMDLSANPYDETFQTIYESVTVK